MDKKDYYEVLGVSKSASQDEIKSAFRKLAKKYQHSKVVQVEPEVLVVSIFLDLIMEIFLIISLEVLVDLEVLDVVVIEQPKEVTV